MNLNLVKDADIFRPVMKIEVRDRKYKEWSRAVEGARNWFVSH